MNYRPEIDGLRAVAVLPVVAFHAGVPLLAGGFAGVDVFFVISGFLITTIIIKEADVGQFSLLRFYERRARRILPALFFVMLATLILGALVMVPYQLEDLAQSVVASLLFVSNILFWLEADYFAVEAASKPLLHTWSLAVEEQFYVFFPLLVMLVYRFARRILVPVIAVIAMASFALVLLVGDKSPSASFFLIQFRAWELLVGALAAIWMIRNPPQSHSIFALVGLAAIVLSFFIVSGKTSWPGPLTLLPVLGTAALLVFGRADEGIGRVLASEPVRFVGLISYSLYLWHLPLLALLHIVYFGEVPWEMSALAVGASFVLAWVSWRFVERPFRTPDRVRLAPFSAILVVALIPLMAFGVMGVRTSGFQSFMVARVPAEFSERVIDRDAEVAARAGIWNPVIADADRAFDDDGMHRVLILGDSLSGDLIVATDGRRDMFPGKAFRRIRLDDLCMPALTGVLSGAALPEGDDRCAREIRKVQNSGLLAAADEVVLAANWQPETVENGITLAKQIAREDTVVSLLGVSAFNDMASLSMQFHRVDEPIDAFLYRNIRSKFLPVNTRMAEAAEAAEGLRYLDKISLFCDTDQKTCDMLDAGGKPAIFDSAHVTTNGVEILTQRILRDGWFE